MLIEVYNEAGELILDNESKVLKSVKSVSLRTPYRINFRNGSAPNGSWASDWETYGNRASNNAGITFPCNPSLIGSTSSDPDWSNTELSWIRPLDGTPVFMSGILWGVATNSNWDVLGGGFDMHFTKQLVPADVSGYIDCYNEAGELTWSLNALLNTPQIMGVFDMSTVRSVNLNNYPAYMKDKLYFTTSDAGAFVVIEDEGGSYHEYRAAQFDRVGDIVYMGNILGQATNMYALMAYIP